MIVSGFFDVGRMVVCSQLNSFSIGGGGDTGRLAVLEAGVPFGRCLGPSPTRDAVSSWIPLGSLGACLRSLLLAPSPSPSPSVPGAGVSTSRSRFPTRFPPGTTVVASLAFDDAEGLTFAAADPRQEVSMRTTDGEPPCPRHRRCTYAEYNKQNGSSR